MLVECKNAVFLNVILRHYFVFDWIIMKTRLQKIIAHAGLLSRRKAETLIKQGSVKVNRQVAELGSSVESGDKVEVGGKIYRVQASASFHPSVIAYYKPEGELVSREDPQKRKNVFSRLPRLDKGRWITIGRLDINTSGLLLFTNYGELANRLMHPSYEIEREYAVRVLGTATEKQLQAMRDGVLSEGEVLKFENIVDAGGEGTNHWYHVTLSEGKNHEVRRIWKEMGMMVSRLIRVRYGDIRLTREIPRGKWRYLSDHEVNRLMQQVELISDQQETLYLQEMTKKGKYIKKKRKP